MMDGPGDVGFQYDGTIVYHLYRADVTTGD